LQAVVEPPAKQVEARAILDATPGVGLVAIDAVVSELGDIRRFRVFRAGG